MEIFYHIIGICPDTKAHFDMLDLIASWDSVMNFISRFSLFIIKTKLLILEGIKYFSK
jgi:hypothetical protein